MNDSAAKMIFEDGKRILELNETISDIEDIALNAICLCDTLSGFKIRMREIQQRIENGTKPQWLKEKHGDE